MATANPAKPTTYTTPVAEAYGYVNLIKPDTKYKAEGEFKIKVKVPVAAPGAVAQFEMLAELATKAYEDTVKKAAKDQKFKASLKGKAPKVADLPFYKDDDEGVFVYTFKTKASYVSKKPGTEGQTITRTVPIWGPNGRYAPDDIPSFGAGSKVRISFTAAEFFTVTVGAGITLRLEAVKLIKAVAYSGTGNDPFGDDDQDGSEDYSGQGAAGGDDAPFLPGDDAQDGDF